MAKMNKQDKVEVEDIDKKKETIEERIAREKEFKGEFKYDGGNGLHVLAALYKFNIINPVDFRNMKEWLGEGHSISIEDYIKEIEKDADGMMGVSR